MSITVIDRFQFPKELAKIAESLGMLIGAPSYNSGYNPFLENNTSFLLFGAEKISGAVVTKFRIDVGFVKFSPYNATRKPYFPKYGVVDLEYEGGNGTVPSCVTIYVYQDKVENGKKLAGEIWRQHNGVNITVKTVSEREMVVLIHNRYDRVK